MVTDPRVRRGGPYGPCPHVSSHAVDLGASPCIPGLAKGLRSVPPTGTAHPMVRLVRWAGSLLGSILALYTFFFVPLGGSRTLWEHTRRIARTPEAQDLGRDLGRAGHDAASKLAREAWPSPPVTSLDAGVPKVRESVLERRAVRSTATPGALSHDDQSR